MTQSPMRRTQKNLERILPKRTTACSRHRVRPSGEKGRRTAHTAATLGFETTIGPVEIQAEVDFLESTFKGDDCAQTSLVDENFTIGNENASFTGGMTINQVESPHFEPTLEKQGDGLRASIEANTGSFTAFEARVGGDFCLPAGGNVQCCVGVGYGHQEGAIRAGGKIDTMVGGNSPTGFEATADLAAWIGLKVDVSAKCEMKPPETPPAGPETKDNPDAKGNLDADKPVASENQNLDAILKGERLGEVEQLLEDTKPQGGRWFETTPSRLEKKTT